MSTYSMSMAASMASSWLNVVFLMWTERRVTIEARLETRPEHQIQYDLTPSTIRRGRKNKIIMIGDPFRLVYNL